MKQTMKEYQENYFENNSEYELYENINCAATVFSNLTGADKKESIRRIEANSNADWIVLNSGKVFVNRFFLHHFNMEGF